MKKQKKKEEEEEKNTTQSKHKTSCKVMKMNYIDRKYTYMSPFTLYSLQIMWVPLNWHLWSSYFLTFNLNLIHPIKLITYYI